MPIQETGVGYSEPSAHCRAPPATDRPRADAGLDASDVVAVGLAADGVRHGAAGGQVDADAGPVPAVLARPGLPQAGSCRHSRHTDRECQQHGCSSEWLATSSPHNADRTAMT